MPNEDESAVRRETYRLARIAFLEANATCHEFQGVLSGAAKRVGQWKYFRPSKPVIRPPAMPTRSDAPAQRPIPTREQIDKAVSTRAAAAEALATAWLAMDATERDQCGALPIGFEALRYS